MSHRRLSRRRRTHPNEWGRSRPVPGTWALDSGGFSELSLFGEWRTPVDQYVAAVRWYARELGGMNFAAPQDWMCEPAILRKTGLDVAEHQRRTVDNFLRLREDLDVVIPVLQGYEHDDYLRCVELYERCGVSLKDERLVGVGTVCRRQDTAAAERIITSLAGLGIKLHGFGVKVGGLQRYGHLLSSADSMAWSIGARWKDPLPGCKHKHCNNCLRYALAWREEVEAAVRRV